MLNDSARTRAANAALYPHCYRNRRAQRAFMEKSHRHVARTPNRFAKSNDERRIERNMVVRQWLAPIAGGAPEETRRLRNAAKRERQARRGAR